MWQLQRIQSLRIARGTTINVDIQAQGDAVANLHGIRWQVGNSYALICSVIRWSAQSATGVDNYAWHLEGRLDVIGRILLTVMRDLAASFDLARMIEDERNDQHAGEGRNAWSLDGPRRAEGPGSQGPRASVL